MDKSENSTTEHIRSEFMCVKWFYLWVCLGFRISPEVCVAQKDMASRLFISKKGVESETDSVFLTWKL